MFIQNQVMGNIQKRLEVITREQPEESTRESCLKTMWKNGTKNPESCERKDPEIQNHVYPDPSVRNIQK